MSYLFSCVHSWWWHLTFGMWNGYRETRTYAPTKEYGWTVRGPLIALTSTDAEYRIMKVFWKAREPQLGESTKEKP